MNLKQVLTSGAVAVLLLGGCGRSPRVQFYTLTPTVPSEVSVLVKNAPSIAIAAVTLPELVDRPQLVVSDAGSGVAILETRRWAEPLKNAIPRLLAENLSHSIGTDRVAAYPQHAANNTDYKIFVDIQRFEATGTTVVIDALWSIRSEKDGKSIAGRSKISEPLGNTDVEACVAAYSKALAAVSKELAQAVRTLQTKE
jgi:uncharacterized protein